MVRGSTKNNFIRNQDGISLTEALITFPLVLLVTAVFVEFGFAVYQWNQTVKAVQLGARLASVSSPLAIDMSDLTKDYGDILHGEGTPPIPTDTTDPETAVVAVSCSGKDSKNDNKGVCDSDEMQRLIKGSDGKCDSNIGYSVPGMCDFNPSISKSNIIISYHRTGLGYVGRPRGPVVTVTLEIKPDSLKFNLPILGKLLGLNTFSIPSFPVSITGEDLCSFKKPCYP